jgi:protein-S-isoprenylcysteine O-methyltransferase Ste14
MIILTCWIIFLLYWWVSARKVKAIAERIPLSAALAYRTPLLLGIILISVRWLPRPLLIQLTPLTLWTVYFGYGLCVAGLFFTAWARRILGGNWSSEVTFKQGHELIQAGPYRFVRHPIYTGILAMLLGTVLCIGTLSAWLGFFSIGPAFWIKLNQEERLLLRHFPDSYPAYKARVKALVPFII